jgi:mono/diheme cytochrome c family protein
VCHGEDGEGNGPAAVALRPKPADLTDPDRQEIPEQDVMAMIQKGKGTMPAFGAVLNKDQLEAVARYVVSLSAGSK